LRTVEDHRKFVVWRILASYLINIKKLSYDDAFNIIKEWLNKCETIRKLSFNADNKIKDNLRASTRIGYRPISFNDLNEENRELYNLVN